MKDFEDALSEDGRDVIIGVLYLCTPFRRSSGDLEAMADCELEFLWNEALKLV